MTTAAAMHTRNPARSRIARSALRIALLLPLAMAPALAQQILGPVPAPPENPVTAAKVALGKALFWEEQLSLTGTVACGTCHSPGAGHSDPRTAIPGSHARHPGPDGVFEAGGDDIFASPGVPLHAADGSYRNSPVFGVLPQVGGRKSPPVTSAAFSPSLFWDGRATSTFRDPLTGNVLIANGGALESQSLGPFLDTSEMGHVGNTIDGVPGRIAGRLPLALAQDIPVDLAAWIRDRTYPDLFAEAFGTPELTPARIAFAIASYQRTLNATQSRFDTELAGTPALTAQERLGRQVFVNLECDVCHAGALHTDNTFRNLGVRPDSEDAGLFNRTGLARNRGQFRVPSLRNVGARAPFMHNGGLATLEDVVDFYLRGGDFPSPNKDPLMVPRSATAIERAALVAYMRDALTDPRIVAEAAPFNRPTLFAESARVPQLLGSGAGATGKVPVLGAIEPAQVDRRFTVSLSNARPGAAATLVVGRTDPGVQRTVPIGDIANVAVTVQAGNAVSGGYASAQIDLTRHRSLDGQAMFGRFYVVDPEAPNGLAVTRAFRADVFRTATVPEPPFRHEERVRPRRR